MLPRAATSVAMLTAALALSACGSTATNSAKDFTGERALVADLIEELETASTRGEAEKICADILARSLRDEITTPGSDCETEIERAIEDADDHTLTVKAVTVTGNRATARVEGTQDDVKVVRTFELVKEGTRWRATSFGAS